MEMVYDVATTPPSWRPTTWGASAPRRCWSTQGDHRALGPGMAGLPDCYRESGQPVIIGGSMETGSYLLAGQATAAPPSSRLPTAAADHEPAPCEEADQGAETAAGHGRTGHLTSAPPPGGAGRGGRSRYKNIDEVVEATELAGLSKRVVKLVPIGNIKG